MTIIEGFFYVLLYAYAIGVFIYFARKLIRNLRRAAAQG